MSTIQVENNLKNTHQMKLFDQSAHYMPCKIEQDGPANVKSYFEPYIQDSNGEMSATFRGRRLDGGAVSLPAGFRAVLATEAKRPLADHSERRFQVVGGFKDFTYWNWDKKPSRNDNLVKALDWIDIAEANPLAPKLANKCSVTIADYVGCSRHWRGRILAQDRCVLSELLISERLVLYPSCMGNICS